MHVAQGVHSHNVGDREHTGENACEVYNFRSVWGHALPENFGKMVKFRGFKELFGCWNKAIACLSPLILLW